MDITLNEAAVSAVLGNISTIHQPSAQTGGSILVDQDWAATLPETVEATLLSFSLSDMPTQRQQTRFDDKGNRSVLPNANSMQAPGIATLALGTDKQKVKLHLPVAAAMAKAGGKLKLKVQKGEIPSGRNQGKIWLSFSTDTPCEGNDLKIWLESQLKAQQTAKPPKV